MHVVESMRPTDRLGNIRRMSSWVSRVTQQKRELAHMEFYDAIARAARTRFYNESIGHTRVYTREHRLPHL